MSTQPSHPPTQSWNPSRTNFGASRISCDMRSPISDRAASKTEPRSRSGVGDNDVNGEADGDPEGDRDGSGLGVGSCEVDGPIEGIKDNNLEGSSETDGLSEGILLLVGAKEEVGHFPQLRGQKINIFWFPRF
mmetsp:Transcript_31054/g.48000  ORF Transcript_31054/g.48000 Transcript_31054/m.48000 type:complete len:133 (-) Transcript_31054:8-406(-)